ncbi:hypothetical protein MTBPR1_110058 [Candidatus Terasakiella magnetica]|uniref:Uncharacterized protein n=1 Tax=Candidatus Terasakiella magnetica TaxID=1867952 RepID=A0A1C3REC5_9PROT|nr:hypothetical protein [Candidatus Terasakiella magnetica]SCA55619.1 hypothetical protein MTBPR1_110058 [Candidatus Terasakiella magnetica]
MFENIVVSVVDPKVSLPVGIVRTPQTRVQNTAPGTSSDSIQRSAQAFVEQLPPEVRERVGQQPQPRDTYRRNRFDEALRSEEQAAVQAKGLEGQASAKLAQATPTEPTYSAPIITADLTLLQAQLAALDETTSGNASLSRTQHGAYHDAYVSAGAQPGGQTAALEAQLKREELENKTHIVPPVLTSLNTRA